MELLFYKLVIHILPISKIKFITSPCLKREREFHFQNKFKWQGFNYSFDPDILSLLLRNSNWLNRKRILQYTIFTDKENHQYH